MAKSNEKASQNQPESRRGKSRYETQTRTPRMVLPERPPREVDNEIVAILLGGNPAQFALQEDSASDAAVISQPALPVPVAEPGAPLPFPAEPEREPAPATVIKRKTTKVKSKQTQAVTTGRAKAKAAAERVATTQTQDASSATFAEFVERWKHGLRKGQLAVCEVLYQKTYALGVTECLTSFAELARLSGLQMRQCFNVIAQLEALGFVERARSIEGLNKKDQGSLIRFHLFPKQ